ncbi:hypothetical protein FRC08_010227 [Ceratobasidium sp. 394]|nr:hypothetical protein FRC08_010227 [Ceratobasidium sp. 394]
MLVYIVRHGETNENRLGIIQGQMDTQLNQAGREQAAATGVALKKVNFIAAYSSDSSRAADTARIILAHHPTCQLVLEPGLRERYMGSLSGTKAPSKRPLPPDVESSRSISKRLTRFWDNTLIPLFIATSTTATTATSEDLPEPPLAEPAVLLVSHGATISKLIRDTLLVEHEYAATCDMFRHGIYNTSVSILRLAMVEGTKRVNPSDGTGNEVAVATEPPSILGELFQFASISHLLKRKNVVKENADMLEQQGRAMHRQ